MMVAMRLAATLIALAGSGCYFWYPSERKAAVPKAPAGSELVVDVVDKTLWSTCSDTKREGCEFKDGAWQRSRVRSEITTSYGGRRLTVGEVRALVAPDQYAAAYRAVEADRGPCRLSLIPSALSLVGALVLTGAVIATNFASESKVEQLAIGGGVGMVGFGLVSYPLGGFACMRAGRTADDHELGRDEHLAVIAHHDTEYEMERARKLVELAKAFNARLAAPAAK